MTTPRAQLRRPNPDTYRDQRYRAIRKSKEIAEPAKDENPDDTAAMGHGFAWAEGYIQGLHEAMEQVRWQRR